jgi:RimJ/RimL family protein N-acetyltransferase
MKILDTERLTLRTLEMEDAAFYLELVNDPSFLKFIGDKGVRTLDEARRAINEGPRVMQRELGHSLYLMQRRSDGAPLGMCGLIKRDSLPAVDIGYAMMPAYWGQGYAHEAAVGVVAHARALGLPRLMAITSPENRSSIGLLLKLGLRFVEFTHLPPDQRATNIYQIDFAHTDA